MMAWAGGIIVILGFFVFVRLFRLVEASKQVFDITKSAIATIRSTALNDYQKEVTMQKYAKKLLALFFLITIGSIAALAIPFGLIWLMQLAKLLTVNEVIETTLSLKFIIVAVIVSIGYFWLFGKKDKTS